MPILRKFDIVQIKIISKNLFTLINQKYANMDFIAQLKAALLAECKAELKAELKDEIKAELLAEIKAEMKADPEPQLQIEIEPAPLEIFEFQTSKEWVEMEKNLTALAVFQKYYENHSKKYRHIRHCFNALCKYEKFIRIEHSNSTDMVKTCKNEWKL